jgi:hypothetical protein
MMTYAYFFDVHGRNGIRNNGVGALSRVHYGRKYNNAFCESSPWHLSLCGLAGEGMHDSAGF